MELMTSHRNYQWLHNLITGDEKWVLYVNYTQVTVAGNWTNMCANAQK
jgi:hypothetical protein